jgi:hypothetical protein
MTPARFPHSDTPGSTLGCQLPRAYRRLLRPSSALDAKASTMCPSQLVTHTTNPTPTTRTPPNNNRGRARRQRPGSRCTQHTPQRTNTHPRTITRRHATTTSRPRERTPQPTRCSRPLSRSQTTTPHPPPTPTQGSRPQAGTLLHRSPRPPPTPQPQERTGRLILQNPNSVSAETHPSHPPSHPHTKAGTTKQEQPSRMTGLFPHL